ncbi:MAG TPA: DUF29 domain-containing protein [Acetobacteraceae bacterium]|nr:DUF29 domain-containing protein [Acetobacteraceae bacterium]
MSDLHETDVLAWSENQAALLRRLATGERVNNQIDWTNVVEEIQSVGRSELAALASHVRVILERLAKLQVSPATAPRAGWRESIRHARAAVAELLEASSSLRRTLREVVAREMPRAWSLVAGALADHGEEPSVALDSIDHEVADIIGTLFPTDPAPQR